MHRTSLLTFSLLILSSVATAGAVSQPFSEPIHDHGGAATFGDGDTLEFNTTDLDLTLDATLTRVLRITNDGIRPERYEVWTSTSGEAGVYTEYRNIDEMRGERARLAVEGGASRGISMTFSARTCYRASCGGSLSIHVQNRETGERFNIDVPLRVSRGVQGVQAPGLEVMHLIVLVLLAGLVMAYGRPRD